MNTLLLFFVGDQKVVFVDAKPNTGNKLALDCTTQQEAGGRFWSCTETLSQDENKAVDPVCPVQGVMTGAVGLLDVPLHHDEEERLVLCRNGTLSTKTLLCYPGLPVATPPLRIKEPAPLW